MWSYDVSRSRVREQTARDRDAEGSRRKQMGLSAVLTLEANVGGPPRGVLPAPYSFMECLSLDESVYYFPDFSFV